MSNVIGKIGFRFNPDVKRPDPKWSKMLVENYATCNLSDGMNKLYTMDMGVQQLFCEKRMAGPAITVKCCSGDNLGLHMAMNYVKPGDVIVVETQGGFGYAVCGDIMISCMIKMGVAGLVVDGCIRDIETVKNMGMPVFARGTVCGAGHKDGPGEVNFPIACGGVVVNPGDIVFGDENGIVVIPQDDIEDAIKGADNKLKFEAKRKKEIEDGLLVRQGMEEILKAKGVI